jgi:GDPmannose 4,6-dehydratase
MVLSIIMNAIIFGANGQDGYYLTKLLAQQQVNVIGVSRKGNGIIGDIGDFGFTEALIKKHTPDYIFHFAANSTTRHYALFENHHSISTGTLNVLESVKLHSPFTKVFLSGSAMQFKNEGLPIDEQTPFEARSPYAVARIQSVYAGRYYRDVFGIAVYAGYFFNHDSPLRSEQHVNQKIAKAALRIAAGSSEKLELGNITVQKEFNYAGDTVEAVWKLVNQTEIAEVVIGSGAAYSIEDWLVYCFKKINKNWRDHVTIKEDFVPEYKILVSNPQLIKSLGWQPEVNFYQLADMMMES